MASQDQDHSATLKRIVLLIAQYQITWIDSTDIHILTIHRRPLKTLS